MAVTGKRPLRKHEVDTPNGTPLAEFQSGEVVLVEHGGTGASSFFSFTATSAGFVPSSTVATSAVMLVGSGWIGTSTIVPRIVSGEVYTYDSTRAKWLGAKEQLLFTASTITSNTFLSIYNILTASDVGYYIPENITLVGISFSRGAADAGTIEIKENDTTVTSLALGVLKFGADMTINVDISATNNLSAYWSSAGPNLDSAIIRLFYKKRL